MLSNVAQFTASEARLLDNYLIHGGSLVFFLGDRVSADNYNSLLAGRTSGGSRQILPARLIAVAKNPGGSLDPLDYRHPIVRKFRGRQNRRVCSIAHRPILQSQTAGRGLRRARPGRPAATPRGRRSRARAATPKPRRALPGRSRLGAEQRRSLDRGPAGSPRPRGAGDDLGRCVLERAADMAAPTSRWCNEILAWCTAGQTQPRNVAVGDPLESALAAMPALTSVSIERPGGQPARCPWRSRAITARGATTIR